MKLYTIVLLYTELMPYNIIVLKELVKKGCSIHVIHYDEKLKTPYSPPSLAGITYYKRSLFISAGHLTDLLARLHTDLIWTAGWMDSLYNKVCWMVRRQYQIPVIAGSDTQWRGGKQWLNVFASRFRHRKWFSHLFVAGVLQQEYAHKLGFDDDHILMHNLSADVSLFSSVQRSSEKGFYPKRLLYMGRFSPEKGILLLLKAWQSIPDHKGWKLTLIGTGPLLGYMNGYPDVEILPFMSQPELVGQMSKSGAYILPSIFEPWALVLHEAAAAGLPVLATSCCGAVPYFVKNEENGFVFAPNEKAIGKAIVHFISQDEGRWMAMGEKSRELSTRILPSSVANTVINLLERYRS